MKRWMLAVILFAGAPLFAQPQIIIDNRTQAQIDMARLDRLFQEALADSTTPTPGIVLHIWSKKDLRSKNARKLESFFASPNEIYLPKMDYLSFVQGVLLATHTNETDAQIERRSRRIWVVEQAVIRVRQTAAELR